VKYLRRKRTMRNIGRRCIWIVTDGGVVAPDRYLHR
jgi:hypothetical protein